MGYYAGYNYGEIDACMIQLTSSSYSYLGRSGYGNARTGAIAGEMISSTARRSTETVIKNCYANINYLYTYSNSSSNYLGGIVGYLYSSASVRDCKTQITTYGYNSSSGTRYSGIIAGNTSSSGISTCYGNSPNRNNVNSYYTFSNNAGFSTSQTKSTFESAGFNFNYPWVATSGTSSFTPSLCIQQNSSTVHSYNNVSSTKTINNANDLTWFISKINTLSGEYKLGADIYMGTGNSPYTGTISAKNFPSGLTLDGNNHTISGIKLFYGKTNTAVSSGNNSFGLFY